MQVVWADVKAVSQTPDNLTETDEKSFLVLSQLDSVVVRLWRENKRNNLKIFPDRYVIVA